jgi:hypothetical protein
MVALREDGFQPVWYRYTKIWPPINGPVVNSRPAYRSQLWIWFEWMEAGLQAADLLSVYIDMILTNGYFLVFQVLGSS